MKKATVFATILALLSFLPQKGKSQSQPHSKVEKHNGHTFLWIYEPSREMTSFEPGNHIYGIYYVGGYKLRFVDGKKILDKYEYTTAPERRNDIIPFSFEEYVLSKMKPSFIRLGNGRYRLIMEKVLLTTKGTICYAQISCQRAALDDFTQEQKYFTADEIGFEDIDSDTTRLLLVPIKRLFRTPLFTSAKFQGRPVPSFLDTHFEEIIITVKSGNVLFKKTISFPYVAPNI